MTAPASRRNTTATRSRAATGGRDDWQTPKAVLDRLRRLGGIGLDPCTSAENPVDAEHWFSPSRRAPELRDGLEVSWNGRGLVYVNPPYSQAAAWADKVAREAADGVEIVSLVAARPDSRWFFRLVWETATAACFWRGRLRFVGAPSSAPFPSVVVYHGVCEGTFAAAFEDAGKIVRLEPGR